MRTAFDKSSGNEPPGGPKLTAAEKDELRGIQIDERRALDALKEQQGKVRALRVEAAERLARLEHPAPVLKPEGVATRRPDPKQQAVKAVEALERKERARVETLFEQQREAVREKARTREGGANGKGYDPAKDTPTGDAALEPQEITPPYRAYVEGLTHQQDAAAPARPDEFPLSWPDQIESEYPLNWPGGLEQPRQGRGDVGGRDGGD